MPEESTPKYTNKVYLCVMGILYDFLYFKNKHKN